MAKDYLPKIGDTFYFKDIYGELQERTCVDILKGEKDFQTIYYTYKDKHGGLFVTESSILNPNSKQVKKLLAAREKKAWKEFWNDRRLEEFCNLFDNIFNDVTSNYVTGVLKEYINSKIK